jgi:DNA-binding IclR family transcriptional regulator
MARPALSAQRALQVLNLLAANPTDTFTLSELARRVGMNLASAHAVLTVLADGGYLVRDARRKTYALGPAVIVAGSSAVAHHPAIEAARPQAEALAAELGLEVTVTARAGTEIVFVAMAGPRQPHGPVLHAGQRVPLVPPLGSVFLAWAPPADVEAWVQRAADTLSAAELDEVRRSLEVVRARGYDIALEAPARRSLEEALAVQAGAPLDELRLSLEDAIAKLGHATYRILSVDPNRSYEVAMITAPVFGPDGDVLVALTIVGLPPKLRGRVALDYAERLRGIALVVTKESHGRIPSPPVTVATGGRG